MPSWENSLLEVFIFTSCRKQTFNANIEMHIFIDTLTTIYQVHLTPQQLMIVQLFENIKLFKLFIWMV